MIQKAIELIYDINKYSVFYPNHIVFRDPKYHDGDPNVESCSQMYYMGILQEFINDSESFHYIGDSLDVDDDVDAGMYQYYTGEIKNIYNGYNRYSFIFEEAGYPEVYPTRVILITDKLMIEIDSEKESIYVGEVTPALFEIYKTTDPNDKSDLVKKWLMHTDRPILT